MSDPAQRNDVPATTVGSADRAAKIEQLLQSGLDHYVQGQFDRAVDVWTRVLFLDRTHAGARAHIRRARAAMAERLRESEALLHAGVDAGGGGVSDGGCCSVVGERSDAGGVLFLALLAVVGIRRRWRSAR